MILFVNGCVRAESRTLRLAEAVLQTLGGTAEEITLYPGGPEGLTRQSLKKREQLASAEDFDDPMFLPAKQFAAADTIVIAAPYWDLLFPAAVRAYLEAVSVSGITFRYGENGIPQGLCRAKRLIYVTTSGGPIFLNFGFDYVRALAENFYGIKDVRFVSAQGLDIWGADTEAILAGAEAEARELLKDL